MSCDCAATINQVCAITLSGLTVNTPLYLNNFRVLSSGSYGKGLSFSGGALTTHIDGTNLIYSGSTITTSLQTGSSPSFTGLTLTGLTVNTPVYANASQVLTSGSYGNGLSFSAGSLTTHIDGSTITTSQPLQTGSSPTFANLYTSGSIGAGTSSPATTLQVNGICS